MNNIDLLYNKFKKCICKTYKLIENIKFIERDLYNKKIYNSYRLSHIGGHFNNNIYKKTILLKKNNIERGKFIYNKIANKIDKDFLYKNNYSYEYKNNIIEINLYSIYNEIDTDNKFKKIFFRVLTFINLLNENQLNKKLILNIYLTDFKKEFNDCILNNNDNQNELGAKNVNSGFTDGISITIFRGEEILKVLIHELIHFYDIDITNRSETCKECKLEFNIKDNTKLLLNEGFVETWANILNILFIMYEENKETFSINLFKNKIKLEKKFCLYQTSKILLNYNFKSYNDFLNNEKKLKNSGLKQSTSVFSYYIAKSIYLFNIEKFLNIYLNKELNENTIFKLDYEQKDLVNLLLENSKNDELIETININIKNLKKNDCNEELLNLKMTSSIKSNLYS
tara:strand:- start:1311 stop:2504 length:1194 start_codon:yes stop_codon:yes gene_type:complete